MRRETRKGPFTERPPALLVVAGTAGAVFLLLPLIGLMARAPWAKFGSLVTTPEIVSALRISLIASLSASALSVIFGLPLAWLLARVPFPGRSLVRALTTLPLVLPPVVGGVGLLLALGRLGLVGRWLDAAFGLTLFGTTTAVVIAETFVAMPFTVVTIEAALRTLDHRYEDAASTLGASSWTSFRRVTLPLIAPAIGAGAVLAWARALGEFGATIAFAGNLAGVTQTIPIAVYLQLQTDVDQAIVLSLVLVAVSVVTLVALRHRFMGVS